MAIFSNTLFQGTLIRGAYQMTEKDIFNDYYRSRIQDTGEHAIIRSMGVAPPTMVPASYANLAVLESSEKVIGVYLTESMCAELVHKSVQEIKEEQLRQRYPELKKLYHQYQMMVQLYK